MAQQQTNLEIPVTPYAVTGDFCRIFKQDMNGLYLLSFLLTADPAKAEQCFVSGLDESAGASRVFKEWARTWARRTIVQNAIRIMQPTRGGVLSALTAAEGSETSDTALPLAAILKLKTFETICICYVSAGKVLRPGLQNSIGMLSARHCSSAHPGPETHRCIGGGARNGRRFRCRPAFRNAAPSGRIGLNEDPHQTDC